MEQYLIKDYDVIEDKRYLTEESDIETYFRDDGYDLFDCGQGYYQDEATSICKIEDKFYKVKITAEILSSKQDRGDRLYWVESIESVTYEEIEKPKPKDRQYITYKVLVTEHEKDSLEAFMGENIAHYEKL